MFNKFKLKINWQRIFQITLWSLLIAAFVVSVGFTEQRRSELICKEIAIHIDDSVGHNFVEENDVRQIVVNKFGNVIGKSLNGINTSVLESLVDNNPFVLNAEVFSTVDGKLVIDVKQRNPVVRVSNAFGENYYIDEKGIFMPISDKYSAQVPIASGNILSKESEQKIRIEAVESQTDSAIHRSAIEKVFLMSDFIRRNEFWNAQVEQIFIDAGGEIELISRVGTQPVLFGDINNMEEKFGKLFLFYKEGLSKTGWNEYKTIDLRYKDQIVCSKN
jgi:cell division protein FtsQ